MDFGTDGAKDSGYSTDGKFKEMTGNQEVQDGSVPEKEAEVGGGATSGGMPVFKEPGFGGEVGVGVW